MGGYEVFVLTCPMLKVALCLRLEFCLIGMLCSMGSVSMFIWSAQDMLFFNGYFVVVVHDRGGRGTRGGRQV